VEVFHKNDIAKSQALKDESYRIAKAKKEDTVKQMNDIVESHQRLEDEKRAYSKQMLEAWVETANRLTEDKAALAAAEANQAAQEPVAKQTEADDLKSCATAQTRSVAAADAQFAKDNSYFDTSEAFIATVQDKINKGFQDEDASVSDDFAKKSCDDAVRFLSRARARTFRERERDWCSGCPPPRPPTAGIGVHDVPGLPPCAWSQVPRPTPRLQCVLSQAAHLE
jgi:hypothetical protein